MVEQREKIMKYPLGLKLAIQCKDNKTGKIGTFLYDPEIKPMEAFTPVFDNCLLCFAYIKKHDLVESSYRTSEAE